MSAQSAQDLAALNRIAEFLISVIDQRCPLLGNAFFSVACRGKTVGMNLLLDLKILFIQLLFINSELWLQTENFKGFSAAIMPPL